MARARCVIKSYFNVINALCNLFFFARIYTGCKLAREGNGFFMNRKTLFLLTALAIYLEARLLLFACEQDGEIYWYFFAQFTGLLGRKFEKGFSCHF